MRDLCFNCPYNKGLELGNGCGNDTCIQENMLFEKDEEPVEISYWRVVMEEKERYEWNSRFDEAIKDNQTGDIVNAVEVLNKQDKRIKELEEELDYAKRDYIPKLEFGLQRANKMGRDAEKENQQLKQQLAESEKENKALKNIRTLERVIPKNTQLNKLSNRDCYLKGFDNAISETIRVFEESYGKDKTELIEERNEYLSDIVKVGGYRHQIKELKRQLHDLPKKIVEEIKEWIKSQIIYCGGKASDVDILIANASNQVLEDLQNILDTILKKYGGESEQ